MFVSKNEFSLHIEQLKIAQGFETYTEAVVYFYENESDHEMADIAKMLNQKIIDCLQYEAEEKGMMKDSNPVRLM